VSTKKKLRNRETAAWQPKGSKCLYAIGERRDGGVENLIKGKKKKGGSEGLVHVEELAGPEEGGNHFSLSRNGKAQNNVPFS